MGFARSIELSLTFCDINKLGVNIDKTKVLVFKNGRSLSRNEKWTNRGRPVDVVNSFTYVAVYFTSRLCLYNMAKRALTHMFSSYLPINTFLRFGA